MVITAELSLYPLKTEYEESIILFIKELNRADNVKVMTHAMSTFVKGESKQVFIAIEKAMTETDKLGTPFSLIIKAINRSLPVEKGFLQF